MTVYLISDGDYVKIGHTLRDVEQRLTEIQTGSPQPIKLINFIPGADISVERELHQKFADLRLRNNGEWFMASPRVEDEFATRRRAVDEEFQKEERRRLEQAEWEAEQKRRREERIRLIAAIPPDVRMRWYLRRAVIALVTLAVGFVVMWYTPKQPVAVWGIVRFALLILTPTLAYQFGKSLPREYRAEESSSDPEGIDPPSVVS